MGFFDQMKMAQNMMKDMSPEQMQELMQQAKESQQLLRDQVKQILDEEINARGLITREELEKRLAE